MGEAEGQGLVCRLLVRNAWPAPGPPSPYSQQTSQRLAVRAPLLLSKRLPLPSQSCLALGPQGGAWEGWGAQATSCW